MRRSRHLPPGPVIVDVASLRLTEAERKRLRHPLVGLDPAMTLVFRQEYAKIEGIQDLPRVLLPQEWLLQALAEGPAARKLAEVLSPSATTASGACSSHSCGSSTRGRPWMPSILAYS